jgi:hypothetical protein
MRRFQQRPFEVVTARLVAFLDLLREARGMRDGGIVDQ